MKPFGLSLIGLVVGAIPAATQPASTDSAKIAETVQTFHRALAQGDSAAALRLLANDVVILESGGIETLAEYHAHHLAADIGFAQATRREPVNLNVVVAGDVAWVTSASRTTGTFRDRPVNSVGAELMVLSRTPTGWTIRAIHWSSRARRPS
ncbi:MAG: YybH family protein [Gemmatimonadales bacterium]